MQNKSPYQGKIKIFSDGADLKSMIEVSKNPLVKGLTTNPSLMRKAGVSDYKKFALEVLANIKDKGISFEVFSDELGEMERQAHEINSWGKNVYVKIPISNTEGVSTLGLVKKLTQAGVKLNVTALLTYRQVLETAQSLQGGAPSIVSVFAGRIADTGIDPMPLMYASAEVCEAYGKDIELLWASSREVWNILQAEQSGCKIITVTNDILKKFQTMMNKDLSELSLDTVKMFKKDSDDAGFKL